MDQHCQAASHGFPGTLAGSQGFDTFTGQDILSGAVQNVPSGPYIRTPHVTDEPRVDTLQPRAAFATLHTMDNPMQRMPHAAERAAFATPHVASDTMLRSSHMGDGLQQRATFANLQTFDMPMSNIYAPRLPP